MQNPKRGKAVPTDTPASKFLYAILKQLDLRSVDWNLVASDLEISNGHAARMRYSRFRQQMEGNVPSTRAPRAKKDNTKSSKGGLSSENGQKSLPSPSPEPAANQGFAAPYGEHISSLMMPTPGPSLSPMMPPTHPAARLPYHPPPLPTPEVKHEPLEATFEPCLESMFKPEPYDEHVPSLVDIPLTTSFPMSTIPPAVAPYTSMFANSGNPVMYSSASAPQPGLQAEFRPAFQPEPFYHEPFGAQHPNNFWWPKIQPEQVIVGEDMEIEEEIKEEPLEDGDATNE
ncbi:uncharacterized protein BO72DRAFT_515166 [Aspergillus fijiensis CBS 313.89]|uniref:Myb-like DNA-binding domain-containing protein n=1 Tax=Aspergillus fijiensis CBS 313.89 TaxID=1448319 RepID=A0A8G1RKB8_9EURO|nr:uncharacterized protein BO72DRAFT_515166 [Aspergillus fijiensis CBS 313.89]RAK74870.1 hypothetical protein BO72DRAFT_515166 [Aspergillus fijiensis CBS 313.89]